MGFPTDENDAKKEALLLAMLRHNGNVERAAAAAGVARSTAFRWVKTPAFRLAYRDARRRAMDEAFAMLETEAVTAVAALKQEFGPNGTGNPTVVQASKAFIGLALKAHEQMAVHQELDAAMARVDEKVAQFDAATSRASGQAAGPPGATEKTDVTINDQAEAISLRTLWMTAIGHGASDIAASLKFNRPQSVAEEQEKLDLVNRLQKADRAPAEGVDDAA